MVVYREVDSFLKIKSVNQNIIEQEINFVY